MSDFQYVMEYIIIELININSRDIGADFGVVSRKGPKRNWGEAGALFQNWIHPKVYPDPTPNYLLLKIRP